uniref:ATPases with chaperone activity, ATP-binding subunit n=1 Tax=Streptococcus suis TaxID=1307 RepID=I3VFP7_STRSU|nr:hypothetical protein [Streptococcus suis]
MIYKSGSPMRATFLRFKEKKMKFFKKKNQNQDQFKRLIHRLSEMSDTEQTKVEQLLDVVFDPSSARCIQEYRNITNTEEHNLDKTIQEAKNKLNTEQLKKNIERFRQGRRESNNNK